MRPTKLTPALLDAFNAVLADELAVIAFTEEELVWQANQRLPRTERISYRTFQRYKAEVILNETQDIRNVILSGVEGHETEEQYETALAEGADDTIETENTALVQLVHETITSALHTQKLNLVRGALEGKPNWRRYNWMLERKFPDFRLRAAAQPATKNLEPEPDKPTADKPIAKKPPPEPELTELQKMERKWKYQIPWAPMNAGCSRSIGAEELYKIEHDLPLDEAATEYQNPYAHFGYLPDERRTGGFYVFTGMGMDKLCHRRYLGPDDSRLSLSQNAIDLQWEEQEKERQQALATKADQAAEAQFRHLEARKAARTEALGGRAFYEPSLNDEEDEPEDISVTNGKPDPWDGEPRPNNPDQPTRGRGQIWGSSVTG